MLHFSENFDTIENSPETNRHLEVLAGSQAWAKNTAAIYQNFAEEDSRNSVISEDKDISNFKLVNMTTDNQTE